MLKRPFSAILALGMALIAALGAPAMAAENQPLVKASLQTKPMELSLQDRLFGTSPFDRLVAIHDKILTFDSYKALENAFIQRPGLYAFEDTLIVIQGIFTANNKVCASGYMRDAEHPEPSEILGCVWARSLNTGELAWVDPGDDTPMQILAREPTTALAQAEIQKDDQKIP